MKITRENNFDLIRLIAALQVVIWHLQEHLQLNGHNLFFTLLSYLPGVPVFFSMSGFLIFASFDRNSDSVGKYFRNRIYRLYPALWTSLLIVILLLIFTSNINIHSFLSSKFLLWIGAQLTFFQFWTPDFLRSWGVGTPNGVLWTIVIEIQFYILVPLLFWIQKKFKINLVLLSIVLIVLSVFANHALASYKESPVIALKLLTISIFPFLYYFLFGVIFYLKFDSIISFLRNKFFIWLLVYIVYCMVFSFGLKLFIPTYWPNLAGLISQILLILMCFSFAYSFIGLSQSLLNGVDISYGIYVYHMLIINTLITYNIVGLLGSLICVVATICIGLLSWHIIEKPFLKLKSIK